MKQEHDLLRAADREGGHNHSSTPADGSVDDVRQMIYDVLAFSMQTVAVGALHDEAVDRWHRLRVAHDGEAGASDVAGEGQADGLAGSVLTQHDARGTE